MMFRVVNSAGPFFSVENNSPSRLGKRVFSIVVSSDRPSDVVHKALRQSNVS